MPGGFKAAFARAFPLLFFFWGFAARVAAAAAARPPAKLSAAAAAAAPSGLAPGSVSDATASAAETRLTVLTRMSLRLTDRT